MVRLVRALAVMLLVAACSMTAPPGPPDASAPAATSPSVSPSASEGSPEPTPATEAIGLPANRIQLTDPAIEMTLPVGWREVTVREWERAIANLPEGASLGNEAFTSRLESGQILTTAEGYTDQAVYVQVEVCR